VKLLIAGGGTGGHVYPAIAIAEEVLARPGGEVLFVGTAQGIEARVVPAAGYRLETLAVSGLKRMKPADMFRGAARLPVALGRSMQIVRRFRPDAVLGVGGYASGPVVLAAALLRVPTAIHEQNSVPGMTNRILARLARTIFVAFEEAARRFAPRPSQLVGNPVRRKIIDALAGPPLSPDRASTVLIVGGSQGARAVNELVLEAAAHLAKDARLPRLLHQTGAADAAACEDRYRKLGVGDRVSVVPFIEDMAGAYASASSVIGRAGALTLAELAIVGKPAILIPLPTAADDHQTRNAQAFADAGAAIVLNQRETDGAKLAAALAGLLADPKRMADMSGAMGRLARPAAARAIVDRLEAMTS
jgi:UDP-N-acetylglucosamine--N-acetylmuramyl-(pentapeptide) pyrophosphoryl-undecaprenol N-acetylglucosamine transferase